MRNMNCERAVELLFGAVDPSDEMERQELASHVADCAECHQFQTQLAGESVDLTSRVVEATTGSACDRAASLLFGDPDTVGRDLLASHLEHCEACQALANADRRARAVLPELASLDPGEVFTKRVVARTRRRSVRRRRWMDYPTEVAYAVAVAVALLMAIPGAPLSAAPAEMLEWLRNGNDGGARGAGWAEATVIPLSMLPASAVQKGSQIGGELGGEASERAGNVGWALDSLSGHVFELGGAMTEQSWEDVRPLWSEMQCDMRLMWRGIRGRLQNEEDRRC